VGSLQTRICTRLTSPERKRRGQEAHGIFEELLKQDAANVDCQRGLAVSLERIAVALWTQGDSVAALASARRALAVRQRISPPPSVSLQWQVELAKYHNRIGVILEHERDLHGALRAYEASLAIAKALDRKHANSPLARHRLGVSLEKIATILYAQNRECLPRALKYYEQAVAIYRTLIRDDPNNTE
jgi:tetratricopeptide (TPR) repeat protein